MGACLSTAANSATASANIWPGSAKFEYQYDLTWNEDRIGYVANVDKEDKHRVFLEDNCHGDTPWQ